MSTEVTIPTTDGQEIFADVGGKPTAGTVVFAHGSGSSRHSSRNRSVARVLQAAGFETVLIDLLTGAEERDDLRTRRHRFDVDLLADRVLDSISWLESTRTDPSIGLFGASTGAAAALLAAAARPDLVEAVVSRGGRPDLAGERLGSVRAPTLLIVGGEDRQVIELNQQALRHLDDGSSLVIVEGAGHLFEEEGKLAEVALLARDWLVRHLAR